VVLLVCLRDVGVSNAQVGWAEVLAVFAFARLVTAIPITPGGAGLVEAALIAGLVGADDFIPAKSEIDGDGRGPPHRR
jgi:uncharacterized membrane protein YbhN (UPF0104 family)